MCPTVANFSNVEYELRVRVMLSNVDNEHMVRDSNVE